MEILCGIVSLGAASLSPRDVRAFLSAASLDVADFSILTPDSRLTLATRGPGTRYSPRLLPPSPLAPHYTVALRGRLDNVRSLLSDLGSDSRRFEKTSDAHLIQIALQRWGTDAASHLYGDYAIAAWNSAEQSLACIRDTAGVVSVYFVRIRDNFAFSTDLLHLKRWASPHLRPNLSLLGEYVIGRFYDQSATLYTPIQRLPAAHQITITRSAIRIACYWRPNSTRLLRYRAFQDYAEHFFEIYRDAVTDRIPSGQSTGVLLSGGIDSSSVAGMTTACGAPSSFGSARAYSMLFPGSSMDESGYQSTVISTLRLPWRRIPWSAFPPDMDWLAQARAYSDIPNYPVLEMTRPLFDAARCDGIRVFFTGEGGDNWLTGTRYPFSGLLQDHKFGHFLRELEYQRSRFGWRFVASGLARQILWAGSPRAVRRLIDRRRSPPSDLTLLSPEYVERWGISDHHFSSEDAIELRDLARVELYRLACSDHAPHYNEIVQRFDDGLGVERRHPLLDRRIAEFAMAVPDHVHHSRAIGKRLLRELPESVLPPAIAERTTRVDFSPVFCGALRTRQVQAAFERPSELMRSLVTQSTLEACLLWTRGVTPTATPTPHCFHCWMIFALEAWHRTSMTPGSPPRPHRSP